MPIRKSAVGVMLCSAALLAVASISFHNRIFTPSAPGPEPARDSHEPAPHPSPTAPVADLRLETVEPPDQPGLRVHIDPATGRMGPPPPEALPAAAAIPANHPLSTAGEGLIETPGQTRGGGVILDLQGRFRSTVVTSPGPDGTMVTRCLGAASPGHSDDCAQCPPPSNTPDQP